MITLALLSDRPEAIAALAAGYRAAWPDWYGPEGPGDAEADLPERAGAAPIPFAVVAFDGDEPVGTAAVTAGSIDSHAHLTPWISGLWVAPTLRGRGVASLMIPAAAAEAKARGVERLYVATGQGRALFERLGWTWLETTWRRRHGEAGRSLAVLALDLA